MRGFGSVALAIGLLVMAFGLFGTALLPGATSSAPIPAQVPGVVVVPPAPTAASLPADGAGLVVAGAALTLLGAVFFVGGVLARRLAELQDAMSRTGRVLAARPQVEPTLGGVSTLGAAAAPPAAEAPRYSNDAAGWRKLILDAEARGWKASTTLSGVHFRNRGTGAELHVRRIEEAVAGLGLDTPPPAAPQAAPQPAPQTPAPPFGLAGRAPASGPRVGAF